MLLCGAASRFRLICVCRQALGGRSGGRATQQRSWAMATSAQAPGDAPGVTPDLLRGMTCVGQCGRNTPFLSPAERDACLQALPLWSLGEDGKSIERRFTAKNFLAAMDWFNRVAVVAEAETHHPDLHLTSYRDVRVVLSTHAVGGLTQPDAIMAAKLDGLPVDYSPKWLAQHPEAEHTALK